MLKTLILGRNKTRGYKNVGDRQPESNLTTFSNHNRDHEVEPSQG